MKNRHRFTSAQVFGLPSSTDSFGLPSKVCDIYNIEKCLLDYSNLMSKRIITNDCTFPILKT